MSGKDPKDYQVDEYKPVDLVIDVPTPNEKGFLRRQNELVKFMHAFESVERTGAVEPDMIERMVEFLLGFVSEPKDRDEAREILWDLSENEYMYVMASIRGSGEDLVPPTSDSR